MKKLTYIITAVLILITTVTADAQICWRCRINDLQRWECAQAPHMQSGHTDCTAEYLSIVPCQMSTQECATYCPTCIDSDGDGIWDKDEEEPPEGTCGECGSPALVRLPGAKWKLCGADDAVRFDLDADGVKELVTWTARDSGLAFLWYDRNGNGVPDDGGELFGDHFAPKTWENGFEVLAAFDSEPSNGMVDEFDNAWPLLRLWVDDNHDGIGQSDELSFLADTDITALGFDYDVKKKHDSEGNLFRFRADLWHGTQKDKWYDVYFRVIGR